MEVPASTDIAKHLTNIVITPNRVKVTSKKKDHGSRSRPRVRDWVSLLPARRAAPQRNFGSSPKVTWSAATPCREPQAIWASSSASSNSGRRRPEFDDADE